MTRASPGTRSPADNSAISPGTRSALGISVSLSSRRTFTRTETDLRSRSAAWPALCSCTKSKVTLIRTMTDMMMKLVISPVSARTALAVRRTRTSGLRNFARNCNKITRFLEGCRRLGPYLIRRVAASAFVRPFDDDSRYANKAVMSCCQNVKFLLDAFFSAALSTVNLPLPVHDL